MPRGWHPFLTPHLTASPSFNAWRHVRSHEIFRREPHLCRVQRLRTSYFDGRRICHVTSKAGDRLLEVICRLQSRQAFYFAVCKVPDESRLSACAIFQERAKDCRDLFALVIGDGLDQFQGECIGGQWLTSASHPGLVFRPGPASEAILSDSPRLPFFQKVDDRSGCRRLRTRMPTNLVSSAYIPAIAAGNSGLPFFVVCHPAVRVKNSSL